MSIKLRRLIVIVFLICSVTLTSAQERVVILDSVQSVKIIKDLVSGDVCRAELKVSDSLIAVMRQRLEVQRAASEELMKAYKTKQQEVDALNEIISNTEKALRRERRKKNVWMYIAAGVTAVLFIR
jgi:hypothetical protein